MTISLLRHPPFPNLATLPMLWLIQVESKALFSAEFIAPIWNNQTNTCIIGSWSWGPCSYHYHLIITAHFHVCYCSNFRMSSSHTPCNLPIEAYGVVCAIECRSGNSKQACVCHTHFIILTFVLMRDVSNDGPASIPFGNLVLASVFYQGHPTFALTKHVLSWDPV